MNAELISNFIERLIHETISGARTWYSLYPVSEDKNRSLYYALFETEWHHVRPDRSFMLPFEQGNIYLISETFESGRDGTVFDGLNLYVQPSTADELTLIMHDGVALYRLSNAILDTLNLPDVTVSFIQDFLDS